MDLATLLGLISAMGIVLSAMAMGGGIGMFINPPSLLIVVGGTFGVVMANYTMSQFFGAVKVGLKAVLFKSIKPEEVIATAVELADAARKGGLLSLEGKDVGNSFLQKGIQLLVDGHEADVVRSMMNKDMTLTTNRHMQGAGIFKSIADFAPAMGMIGTLVGLVQMLANMSDPASIGPAMAVALLTTLYGAMIANMICLPIAAKLENRADEELLIQKMCLDALQGIQSGQNPRVIEEVLKNYLPLSKRPSEDDEE